LIVCGALVGAGGAACFGGGPSSGKAPDSSKIATATLPAKLPEPKILSNSAVQTGGGLTYTIKDGDTLAGIASRLGIALDDLRAANPGIDPGTLRVGQTIKLPQNTEAPAATAAATTTPARGSATARVATATEPPVTETPAPPTEAPTVTPGAPQDTPAAGATETPVSVGQTYTVQEGDYPASIAEKFGVSLDDLLAANPGINPTGLHIGDVIVIPPKRP
jgi:LysM repeat protein